MYRLICEIKLCLCQNKHILRNFWQDFHILNLRKFSGIFGRIFIFPKISGKLVQFPAPPLGGTSIFKSSTVSTKILHLEVSYDTENAKMFKVAKCGQYTFVWLHILWYFMKFDTQHNYSIFCEISALMSDSVNLDKKDWTLSLWSWFHDHGVWANTTKIPKYRQFLTEVYKFSELKLQ